MRQLTTHGTDDVVLGVRPTESVVPPYVGQTRPPVPTCPAVLTEEDLRGPLLDGVERVDDRDGHWEPWELNVCR